MKKTSFRILGLIVMVVMLVTACTATTPLQKPQLEIHLLEHPHVVLNLLCLMHTLKRFGYSFQIS